MRRVWTRLWMQMELLLKLLRNCCHYILLYLWGSEMEETFNMIGRRFMPFVSTCCWEISRGGVRVGLCAAQSGDFYISSFVSWLQGCCTYVATRSHFIKHATSLCCQDLRDNKWWMSAMKRRNKSDSAARHVAETVEWRPSASLSPQWLCCTRRVWSANSGGR